MNTPSKDIATLLNSSGDLSLVLGTDLFYSKFPANPDDCVAVFDNPGGAPLLSFQKETSDYYYSSVSVRCRNVNYDLGYAQIFSILEYLHGLHNQTINATLYTLIKAENDPQVLGWDDNDRIIFFINFMTQRRKT